MFQAKIKFFEQDGKNCEQIRRIPMPENFEQFLQKVSSVTQVPSKLGYIDEQNDLVTFSTQEEFEIAISIAKQNDKRVIEFHVIPESRVSDPKLDTRMMARFVSSTIPEGTVVAPSTPLVQKFKFRNESKEAWPVGCQFLFTRGNVPETMSKQSSIIINPTQPVEPNQEIEFALSLVSPAKPGRYVEFWRLAKPLGVRFGQRALVSIVVPGEEAQPNMHAEQMATLESMGFNNTEKNARMLNRHNGNLELVVEKLSKKNEHHGHHEIHGKKHEKWFLKSNLSEPIVKVLEQVPPRARHLELSQKLDFLEAHHIGRSREENIAALASHQGRLKKTIISLMS